MIRVSKLAVFLLIGFLGLSGTNVDTVSVEITETFGAQPDNRGPIGGGAGYKNLLVRPVNPIKSRDELLAALKTAKTGDVVYVADEAEIDLTFFSKIEIPAGVTLASGRGRDGSLGALLFTTQKRTWCLLKTAGDGVRITGLRIQGPEPNRNTEYIKKLLTTDPKAYKNRPISRGIWIQHKGTEIDNCELSGWNAAAITLWPSASETYIHHNYIHHCQERGLGYGVTVSRCDALIEYNLFDWCRHCIMSPGYEGSRYEARHNIVLASANDWSFDVHGQWDADRGYIIAGTSFNIHHNTFKATGVWAVGFSGRPIEQALVHHNWFLHLTPKYAVYQRHPVGNMKVFRNLFGPDKVLVE